MGADSNHRGGITTAERAFIKSKEQNPQPKETEITDKERITIDDLIVNAFVSAIDEIGKDPDINAIREKIRIFYSAEPASPLDLIITGFCMGIDKGIDIAECLIKGE